jgi:hypothetical protein
VWSAAIIGVAVVLSACSNDDPVADDIAPEPTSTEAAPTADTVAGTTSTSEVDASTPSDGDIPAACGPLREVKTLSDEIGERTSDILVLAAEPSSPEQEAETLAAFAQVADDIDALLPDVIAAYARAEQLADGDIADDLALLADGTEALTPPIVEAIRTAESFADLDEGLQSALEDPDLQESAQQAGLAALRLDEFTIPECGFQLSNA